MINIVKVKVVLVVVFLFNCGVYKKNNRSKKIVLPNNYQGRVVIFYNFKNPTFTAEKETDTIFIDNDGIETVDFDINTMNWTPEYLYKDAQGNYHKYDIYRTFESGGDVRGVYRHGTFGVFGNTDSIHFRCTEFIIADKSSVVRYLTADSVGIFEKRIQSKLNISW